MAPHTSDAAKDRAPSAQAIRDLALPADFDGCGIDLVRASVNHALARGSNASLAVGEAGCINCAMPGAEKVGFFLLHLLEALVIEILCPVQHYAAALTRGIPGGGARPLPGWSGPDPRQFFAWPSELCHGYLIVSATRAADPGGGRLLVSRKWPRLLAAMAAMAALAATAPGRLSRLRFLVAEGLQERPDVVHEDVGQFVWREVPSFVMNSVLLKVVVLLRPVVRHQQYV